MRLATLRLFWRQARRPHDRFLPRTWMQVSVVLAAARLRRGRGPAAVLTGDPLAWRPMARSRVVIAELIIPPEVEAKIRQKPNHRLTGDEVREALIYARDAQAKWVEHKVHGRRVEARGTTYRGRPVIAYVDPLDPANEEEGTFVLRTAMTDALPALVDGDADRHDERCGGYGRARPAG